MDHGYSNTAQTQGSVKFMTSRELVDTIAVPKPKPDAMDWLVQTCMDRGAPHEDSKLVCSVNLKWLHSVYYQVNYGNINKIIPTHLSLNSYLTLTINFKYLWFHWTVPGKPACVSTHLYYRVPQDGLSYGASLPWTTDVRFLVFVLFVPFIGKNCLFEQNLGCRKFCRCRCRFAIAEQLVCSIKRLRIPPKLPWFTLRNAEIRC